MAKKGVPREPHKEGCACVVCRAKRESATSRLPELVIIAPTPIPPPPSIIEVKLSSLSATNRFRFVGQEHLVREKLEDVVVCYNLFTNDTVTLGGSTMVKPI
jgi:hypothetical protein